MMTTATRRYVLVTVAALLSALPLPSAAAAECTAMSGTQRVAVLELYTSEGCDSCPPTDRWVSELPARKLGADRLLPLAFHVDYWNQLGWIDPYAQSIFSARQRQHSKRRAVGFVVTPQLLLNGADYRAPALFDDIDGRVRTINAARPQADIRVKLMNGASVLHSRVDVNVAGGEEPRRAQVWLALYENNLATVVKAGENKGRTLHHDFVVRSLVGPLALDDKGNLTHAHSFVLDARWKPADTSLAVFVQHPQSGDVLQALSASCR